MQYIKRFCAVQHTAEAMREQRFLCPVCEATTLAKQTTTQSPHKTYYVIVKVQEKMRIYIEIRTASKIS